MWQYLIRRVLVGIPLVLVVTMVAFGLLELAPGSALDAYAPPSMPLSPSARAALARELGLDQPLPVRYLDWLWQALHGNLGVRTDNFQPVSQAIATHIGPTLELMATGLVIGIVVGIALGVVSAVMQYSALDFVLTVLAFLGLSLPAFLAGLLGLYLFSLKLDWFPIGGTSTAGRPASLGDSLLHLVLPACLLSITHIAQVQRYTRAAMLEVIGQDYVRTARAKGAGRARVLFRHALRNAMLPIVTIIGANVPNLISGAVFLETIFTWPGMGSLLVQAVSARDFPLITGLLLVIAIVVVVANLATDLTYAAIDPRIGFDT